MAVVVFNAVLLLKCAIQFKAELFVIRARSIQISLNCVWCSVYID